ncbi:T-complex protein 1 subunit gamma [Tupaia chinensis]|uniref:T-complex protein 1 subunit gamma n=1 Tax=Tupaia chinensis TaxID=246437 RepID=L9L9U6_TUPCH|nr:T-complex protein 1 subunit gamma [Tupaia chinensis]
MTKMPLDPMGGVVMPNDGNALLREIQVQHPTAKSMMEISQTQERRLEMGPPRSAPKQSVDGPLQPVTLSRMLRTVQFEENGQKERDIKKYAKVEKTPGGIIEARVS